MKKCIVRRKYRGSSENIGMSDNGACLHRKLQGLSENRDLSKNRGPSENGACLHRKVQGLSENKGLACIGKYRD